MIISQKLAECQAKLSIYSMSDMKRSLDILLKKWHENYEFCTEMDASLLGAPDLKHI